MYICLFLDVDVEILYCSVHYVCCSVSKIMLIIKEYKVRNKQFGLELQGTLVSLE